MKMDEDLCGRYLFCPTAVGLNIMDQPLIIDFRGRMFIFSAGSKENLL
jgi:hypothetical protein